MITGANTNVSHRGVVFHVQTEDSGRANPHIISHLYHGGTILASEKTDYSDRVDAEDLEAVVRGLIDAQHKQMLSHLKAGQFDQLIAERLGDTTDGGTADALQESPPTAAVPVATKASAPAAGKAATAASGRDRAFGEGVVSQKPLDEVILEYLAEKARDRRSAAGDAPARKTRSGG